MVDTFDKEELIWPDVTPKMSAADILKQDGMFKFRQIKKALDLQTIDLSRLKNKVDDDQALYVGCGILKPLGSQYVIRMSRFRHTYNDIKKGRPIILELQKKLPNHVKTANDLHDVRGVFYFASLLTLPPFSANGDAVKAIAKKMDNEEARTQLGIWYSNKKYLVELPRFLLWFREHFLPPIDQDQG